jgi:UDP-N-acetylmuramate dehydrogenase
MLNYPFDLTALNSYGIHARAKNCYFPNSEENILVILDLLGEVKPIFIGSGSNVIFIREEYDRPFIFTISLNLTIDVKRSHIEVGAGIKLSALVYFMNSHGLDGFSRLVGIPGTVGGAICMNSGAYGSEISNNVLWVEAINIVNRKIYRFFAEEISFGYRKSIFQSSELLITRAAFRSDCVSSSKKLSRSSVLQQESEHFLNLRCRRLPYHFPNAGSVFKRPSGKRPVGELVDILGLKGFRMNDAMISLNHGGVIVNVGQASGGDVIDVANRMKHDIKMNFGLCLEYEQVII